MSKVDDIVPVVINGIPVVEIQDRVPFQDEEDDEDDFEKHKRKGKNQKKFRVNNVKYDNN